MNLPECKVKGATETCNIDKEGVDNMTSCICFHCVYIAIFSSLLKFELPFVKAIYLLVKSHPPILEVASTS